MFFDPLLKFTLETQEPVTFLGILAESITEPSVVAPALYLMQDV